MTLRFPLDYGFMQHAFLAGTGIALAAGLTGYFIVLRNQAFTAEALGHAGFTGGLGALVLGLQLVPGLFATTIVAALAIGSLGGRARGRDIAVGTVFAWILGLGALFLSLYTLGRSATGGGTAGISVLFGSILGLDAGTAMLTALAGVLIAGVVIAVARPLLFASIDPEVAAARGLRTRRLAALFLVLLGATVAEAVQAVGALLVFALMVTPAATAQRLTSRPYAGLALAATLAVLSLWVGLVLAFYLPYPASFFITAVAFGGYLAVELGLGYRPSRGPGHQGWA